MYNLKSKNAISTRWPPETQDHFRHYPQLLKAVKLSARFKFTLGKILDAKINNNAVELEQHRLQLTQGGLINFVIYEVQASSLPTTDNIPSITQVAFYKPLTNETFTAFIKPSQPIDARTAAATNIYNSVNPTFKLQQVSEQCNQQELDYPILKSFNNDALLQLAEVQAAIEEIQAQPSATMLTDEELITQAIGDYLNQATRQPIFLDQLDAQPFHKVLPAIMEFIFSTEQEGELTLMLAHNGAYWAEPLFRAELERACSAETVNRMLFVDSKQFFKHLFRNIKIEKIGGSDDDIIWSRLLGEKRAVSFDSLTDAISLWNTIIDVCDRMYGRSDIEFIFSKITEDVYLQKCQLKGI